MRKEKGKKKMLEYDTDKEESDRSESDTGKNKDGPSEMKSESAKRALKSANNTWELVDPPRHYKPIGCKWVYKIKYNTDSSINRYKAKLVAKGYAQTHGIAYNETFALTTKMMMVRVVLGVVAARG